MMKPLSPTARAKVQTANDLVLKLLADNLQPHEVIDEMIEQLGAVTRFRSGTNQLICAGIIGSGTCNTSPVLLASWRRKAMLALLASQSDDGSAISLAYGSPNGGAGA